MRLVFFLKQWLFCCSNEKQTYGFWWGFCMLEKINPWLYCYSVFWSLLGVVRLTSLNSYILHKNYMILETQWSVSENKYWMGSNRWCPKCLLAIANNYRCRNVNLHWTKNSYFWLKYEIFCFWKITIIIITKRPLQNSQLW